jgi:FKBP-type peptidyl-prolyl cis-trans isomerase SlyD
MKVGKGSVVFLDYRLHLGDGVVVDASSPDNPLTYLHGEGQIVPGLEKALEGLDAGEARQVVVAPEDAYGPSDPQGIQEVPRTSFPPDVVLQPGMELMAHGPEGEPVPFAVREVRLETVLIDLNHPLAGKTLHFDVMVREVRQATAEELAHGHVHGPGGDHEELAHGHVHGPGGEHS